MEYNLIESQKEAARNLVKLFREQNLPDQVGYLNDPEFTAIFTFESEERNFQLPRISRGTFLALADEKMIDLLTGGSITFREKLFTAVDSDFGAIKEVTPISADKTVYGLSLKTYREILNREFSKSEIKDLCEDISIKYEDLGGEDTLSGKVRELVKYCERHGRFLELLITTAKARPRNPWNELWD